jgi:glycosyltransferase involved in cell wall biosynthesis
VDVSVIVPAYRAEATLETTVASLLAQEFSGSFEVLVSVSADDAASLPRLPDDPRLRVITHVPRSQAAASRNRAAALAAGRLFAFTDADVLAPPDWLERLVAASDAGRLCVAGSVLNGTPESAAGTVEYLVEFLDLHPARPPATAWHGATCNLLVPRALWDELGPFPEDMGGGEDTLLTVQARSQGRFVFAPEAPILHLNRTQWRVVIGHHAELGRFAAHLGRRSEYKLRALVQYTALAPVAAAGRVVSLYARAAAWDRQLLRRALVLSPMVIVTLGAFGVGLMVEGFRIDRAARRGRPLYPSARQVP